jgi:hypothetical protein
MLLSGRSSSGQHEAFSDPPPFCRTCTVCMHKYLCKASASMSSVQHSENNQTAFPCKLQSKILLILQYKGYITLVICMITRSPRSNKYIVFYLLFITYDYYFVTSISGLDSSVSLYLSVLINHCVLLYICVSLCLEEERQTH